MSLSWDSEHSEMDMDPSAPRLPPELILNVFEHSRRPVLVSCSNVCRQWRDMSVSYRFNSIFLRCEPTKEERRFEDSDASEDEAEYLSIGAIEGEKRPRKNLTAFLQFLKDHPYIAQSVRELTIDLSPHKRARAMHYADRLTFIEILRSLPKLKILSLNDVFLPNWRSEVLTDVKLERLTIRYPSFYGGGAGEVETIELLQMITIFGGIRSLNFEQFSFESSPDTVPLPPRLGITSLNLRRVWAISPFLDALKQGENLRSPDTEGIHSLVVQDLETQDLLEMNWCLDVLGTNLTHFGCCIPFKILSQFDTLLNLERCDKLRSLTIYLKMACDKYHSWVPNVNGQAWQYLLKVLQGLPFDTSPMVLDSLTLSIGFQDLYAYNTSRDYLRRIASDIEAVEGKLVEFVERKVLRRVKVELTRSMIDGAIIPGGFLPEFFPQLHRMGVLSFSNEYVV